MITNYTLRNSHYFDVEKGAKMLAEGQEIDVFVTHVEQAGSSAWVWAQIDRDEANQLETLMSQVQARASNLSTVDLNTLEVGDVCLALYQEDQNW